MKKIPLLVICGEELVSFEVANKLKVVSVKLDPMKVRYTVSNVLKEVKPNEIIISASVDDMLTKEDKKQMAKDYTVLVVDTIDFTTI